MMCREFSGGVDGAHTSTYFLPSPSSFTLHCCGPVLMKFVLRRCVSPMARARPAASPGAPRRHMARQAGRNNAGETGHGPSVAWPEQIVNM
jgi:hypothetical protein